MISAGMKRALEKRDPYCMHCGEDVDLVIHHRKNRGMGGSKELDRLSNLMRICSWYNGFMESSATSAEGARENGHKLRQWDDFSEPVKDETNGIWYLLDDKGNKTETVKPESLF